MTNESDYLNFSEEQPGIPESFSKKYKVIIADDDQEVHDVTRLVLRHFHFEGIPIELYHCYDGVQTIELLKEHKDAAVLFLDVVMESNSAGLEVVRRIRQELGNQTLRIILRTGQPGEAPEETIIYEYDINDYRLKTDMTDLRMKMTLVTALRGYRDMAKLETHQKGLEKIISASAELFEHHTLDNFFRTILVQLGSFYEHMEEVAYLQERTGSGDGFVAMDEQGKLLVVAGTGKYEVYIGENADHVAELSDTMAIIRKGGEALDPITRTDKGYLIVGKGNGRVSNYIFIEGHDFRLNTELINLFMTNYTVAVDNFVLRDRIDKAQKHIITTFANAVEKHFEETGSHIERIAKMIKAFCRLLGCTDAECELIEVASTLHDIGKIAIPDAILKKPGKLDFDEYEIMKSHATIGEEILSNTEMEILSMAAEIAGYHHEKYDGSGYPKGLKGEAIPRIARIMAIVDVYDAITHKRIYKEAASSEEAIGYIKEQKGIHFDPALVDLFLEHLDEIVNFDS